ncbi:acyl-CoA carboxylase subunit beta [Pelagicoccus mobilis]|uniref:Propionyl-CoA carboxylase beta chain n=1 Tax=Pelagicoccus mobilis TaxID=415221 RepID=A0A934VQW1_9BACT|nr:acyl-CoA carboxylase subunit beta [Pelagicoccus mobilis]MBK1876983.1 acyl-CoA carboxylase subunit beta [Pelagicoccus mobilis]
MSVDTVNLERIGKLRETKASMRLGGGEKRLDSQRKKGKLTVWERIEYFFDAGTFEEVGGFIDHRSTNFGLEKSRVAGDGVVTGFGRVNGMLVYIAAQDFTVMGGSLGEMHGRKIANIMDVAIANGAPMVMLNDSGGARIQEGIGALCGYGEIFFRNTKASGVIPQISVIMGPCAGGAVYSPGITDFVAMVQDSSYMFITGPEVIKTVTGENVTKDTLGGGDIHMEKSGVATYVGEDDETTLDWVKVLLSYLPANNDNAPARVPSKVPQLDVAELDSFVPSNPNKGYDIGGVIDRLVDSGSFFELQENFAKNISIGFARMDGISVGVVANNPKNLAGCLDVDASDKAARFVRFCDAFNIPLLTLVDVPGFLPGTDQEYSGIIRHGAKLLYAYSEATVPKLTVIMRKSYGGAYICMCSKHLGADMVVAWPGSEIAVMGPKGAVNIIFRKDIMEAEDQAERAKELESEYTDKFANPQLAASMGYVDNVIEPNQTRSTVINYLKSNLGKRQITPRRKHGNIPL